MQSVYLQSPADLYFNGLSGRTEFIIRINTSAVLSNRGPMPTCLVPGSNF